MGGCFKFCESFFDILNGVINGIDGILKFHLLAINLVKGTTHCTSSPPKLERNGHSTIRKEATINKGVEPSSPHVGMERRPKSLVCRDALRSIKN